MKTSLDAAVEAKVITQEAAHCGLNSKDIEKLHARGFDAAEVLIRFRSSKGDARAVLTVKDFFATMYFGAPIRAESKDYFLSEIRDVFAVVTES